MTVSELQRFYDYAYWANRKLLTVIAQLTQDEFTRTVAGSYGSVRNTMVHVLSAEWGWLDRCGGTQRGPALKADDYPTVESLTKRWTAVEGHVREFLSTLDDDDLSRIVEFTLPGMEPRAMRLGELLHHAAVHSVHHRGQVALLLRLLGHVPGNFDILFYYAEHQPDAVT
jgi:uncharacterized damage-inducible protein DinB